MRSSQALRTLCAFVAGLGAAPAFAHELGIVRVHLTESAGLRYTLDAKLPATLRFGSAMPLLPPECRTERPPAIQHHQGSTEVQIAFDCGTAPGSGAVLRLPWPYQGAFISAQSHNGASVGRFFAATALGVDIPLGILGSSQPQTRFVVAQRYLLLGVDHILTGWDHLAFVLTLCLIAGGIRLLKLISAFTLGHSLTLALAALGVVHVPVPPTEACIALSIAFMAAPAARGDTIYHGGGLVFGFGLLHGLGFASALAESGIERSEFFIGLVTFNLGVECGQIMFVAVVFALALLKRPLSVQRRRQFATAAAYALGLVGAFWTFQRTL